MVELRVLNSNLTVVITLQNWTEDTITPFLQTLTKKGFNVNESPPFAWKDTTNNLTVQYIWRRLQFYITNNLISPDTNLREVFSVLTQIGYPPQESIDRIDIWGGVSIKAASTNIFASVVSPIIKTEIRDKVNQIFGKPVNISGLRLLSAEPLTGDISKSPFAVLIEPLLTDRSNSKFFTNIVYASSNSEDAIYFLNVLYDRLRNIIQGLMNE